MVLPVYRVISIIHHFCLQVLYNFCFQTWSGARHTASSPTCYTGDIHSMKIVKSVYATFSMPTRPKISLKIAHVSFPEAILRLH